MSNVAVSPISLPLWLPRVAEAGLVLLAAWLVAGWLTGGVVDQAMRGSVNSDAVVQGPDAAAIAAFPLFGKQAVAPVAPVVSAPVAAAPTRLNIRLLGTVVAGDRSMAVMQLDVGE